MAPHIRYLPLLAVLLLAGCSSAPQVQSEYRLIPPKTSKGRTCAAKCDGIGKALLSCHKACGGTVVEDRLCRNCDDTQLAPVATPLSMNGEEI